MGLIRILLHPRWWWKHRWYTWRSTRLPNHTELEKTVEYDNGNKRHYYGWYWNYRDPKTEYEYKNKMMGTSKVEYDEDDEFTHKINWVKDAPKTIDTREN